MRRYGSWAVGVMAGLSLMAACVGDDPDQGPSTTPDASTSSSSSSSSSGAPGVDDGSTPSDGGAREYGVFLTPVAFSTSFLEGKPYAARVEYANELCTQAATEARVIHAQEYRAFLAAGADDTEGFNDATRIQSQWVGDGTWCAVRTSAAGAAPNCATQIDVIFPSSASIISGPRSPLLTDATGAYVDPGANSIPFFSGFVRSGDGLRVATCSGWSFSAERDSGAFGTDAGQDIIYGAGETGVPAPTAGPYAWATGRELCDRRQRRLLCVERPH